MNGIEEPVKVSPVAAVLSFLSLIVLVEISKITII